LIPDDLAEFTWVLQNSFPDAGPLIHFIYSDQCYLIFLKVDFRGISQPYYGVNIEKNNYPIENIHIQWSIIIMIFLVYNYYILVHIVYGVLFDNLQLLSSLCTLNCSFCHLCCLDWKLTICIWRYNPEHCT
jgi:hypothetical protein